MDIVGRRRRRRRRGRFKKWRNPFSLTIFFFLLCFCANYVSCHNPQILSESMRLLTIEADGTSHKDLGRNKIGANNGMTRSIGVGGARRLLGGPGSSPPRCTSKCDGCMPCKPVHVPVPRGTPVTTEYYPEAWRCKCGNKFYMP